MFYTLINKIVIPVDNVLDWYKFTDDLRAVAFDRIGNVDISTVFLGMDHRMGISHNPHPVVFETIIFGGDYDGCQWRYCTWGEAEEGHKRVVEKVRLTLESEKLIKKALNDKDNRSPKGRSVQGRDKNMYMLSRLSRQHIWSK